MTLTDFEGITNNNQSIKINLHNNGLLDFYFDKPYKTSVEEIGLTNYFSRYLIDGNGNLRFLLSNLTSMILSQI